MFTHIVYNYTPHFYRAIGVRGGERAFLFVGDEPVHIKHRLEADFLEVRSPAASRGRGGRDQIFLVILAGNGGSEPWL